jgi:RHS repeat-associated core domain
LLNDKEAAELSKNDATFDTNDYTTLGVIRNTITGIKQRYGYNGREASSLSKNLHYRYRNYDPEKGRFHRRDPLLYTSDSNLYSYVANKPVNFIDPFGLELEIWGSPNYRQRVGQAL